MEQRYTDVMSGKRSIVFFGESGSGKTEIALNLAMGLRQETDRVIHFFDMDQTKPLFRARDAVTRLEAAGVTFHSNFDTSIEDVAAIAPGVLPALGEADSYVIFDIGGNEQGARVIGQFFREMHREDSLFVLPVNPYRPWSGSLEDLSQNLTKITQAARAEAPVVFSNPNFCAETTAEDVVAGHEKLKKLLGGRFRIPYVCALAPLCPALENRLEERLLPLTIQILYPWME